MTGVRGISALRERRGILRRQDQDTPVPAANAANDPISFDRVEAYFQPQVCCDTGAITGFELLARIDHPRRGLLQPAAFLPSLDAAGQRRLTRIMLGKGLDALRHWNGMGFAVETVSINVSTADLGDAHFADFALWELDRQDIDPARLVIEVMEDLLPHARPAAVRENLIRLTGAGCCIDLDDFGTGYSGLDALRRLPVRRVKIDRRFVDGCDSDAAQQRMMRAILALAECAGVQAVAEGVETAGQHAFLAQMGCSHVQGFAVGAPMPLAETLGFLTLQQEKAGRLPLIRRPA